MPSVQIRNVPEEAHRELKSRAALRGQSLSEYALMELLVSLHRPTVEELAARIRARGPSGVTESAADAVRAERDAR